MAKTADRTFKAAARDAKRRLKSGYWNRFREEMEGDLERAREKGTSQTAVREYYRERAHEETRGGGDEEFYLAVKRLLDEEGEVCDAIGRLTDRAYYNTLDYTHKQRYTLELSARYLRAVERYNKEKSIGKI